MWERGRGLSIHGWTGEISIGVLVDVDAGRGIESGGEDGFDAAADIEKMRIGSGAGGGGAAVLVLSSFWLMIC